MRRRAPLAKMVGTATTVIKMAEPKAAVVKAAKLGFGLVPKAFKSGQVEFSDELPFCTSEELLFENIAGRIHRGGEFPQDDLCSALNEMSSYF